MAPALSPQKLIDRPLSFLEYYFASSGLASNYRATHAEIGVVLEGQSSISCVEWRNALDQVIAVNPACRLRVVGERQHARWSSDGAPTRFRYIENSTWDGRSDLGMEFFKETTLHLNGGPTSELIILMGSVERIVIRAHHAAMDALGIVYFFEELFRALRREPLLGTNANFSDMQLAQSLITPKPPQRKGRFAHLTGCMADTEYGNVWRRITVDTSQQEYVLGQIAVLTQEFAQRYSAAPVRILIPVSLRRHRNGLRSMMNFVGLISVEMSSGDNANNFRKKLQALLRQNAEAYYSSTVDLMRYLPMRWVDWLSNAFARRGNGRDTMVISNLGVINSNKFSSEKFIVQSLYPLPAFDGNNFLIMATMNGTTEISVGMPTCFATGGRFEDFIDFLQKKLQCAVY